MKWHGIINEEVLTEIANSSLLNRYLLMGIRTLQPLEAATKCQLVSFGDFCLSVGVGGGRNQN